MRWDLCQQAIGALGARAFVELAPAGALVGMAKRELPGIELLAVKSPADLEKAQHLIDTFSAVAADAAGIGQDGHRCAVDAPTGVLTGTTTGSSTGSGTGHDTTAVVPAHVRDLLAEPMEH